jgi:hypothetical protein
MPNQILNPAHSWICGKGAGWSSNDIQMQWWSTVVVQAAD